jgi:HEAT repeat protein
MSEYVRSTAVDALGNLGPKAELIPALTRLLADQNGKVRESAARALGTIGPATVVSSLMELLADKNDHVRLAAASALGQIGPEAKIAIPALTQLLDDEFEFNEKVRQSAAESLQEINPRPPFGTTVPPY